MTSEEKKVVWETYLDYVRCEFGEDNFIAHQEDDADEQLCKGLGLMYTTVGDDEEHELQATLFPNTLELVCEVDWKEVMRTKYETVHEMLKDVFFDTWSDMYDKCICGGIEKGILTGCRYDY